MRLNNFVFTPDLIGIKFEGQYLDLHNFYELTAYKQTEGALKLHFRKDSSLSGQDAQPPWIILEILGVSKFEVRGEPSSDLEEYGFFENSTGGRVDYNGLHCPASGFETLLFRFIGGGEIMVVGTEAHVLSLVGI